MTRAARTILSLLPLALALPGCGDSSRETDTDAGSTTTTSTTSAAPATGSSSGGATSTASTEPAPTSGATMGATTTGTDASTSEGATTSSVDPCEGCDGPGQTCVDGVCEFDCAGALPDPCGDGELCDVLSGECVPPFTECTLTGPSLACGASSCGPGSICDGVGECLPIAPCSGVTCEDGSCWGIGCSCERSHTCEQGPDLDALNGPFSTEIGDLEFADDCTAWMVTLRSGTDYVRRLTTDGELTEWPGVSNLNMGEVKVLKQLSIPQDYTPGGPSDEAGPGAEAPVEGLGEVAITYTCCASCGCFVDPPQGVARLVEDDMQNPLPIVIVATVTTGDGPFGSEGADSGPFGLTWGEDRVLYVGNSTQNGEYNTADLDEATQDVAYTFDKRVHASAPISPVHLLVAVDEGDIYRFNTMTGEAELVMSLGVDVTSLSHDAFDGTVYAGLSSLEIIMINPWAGTFEYFDHMMPGVGRVTVSPDGALYFAPVQYLANNPIERWDIPDAF